MESVSGGGVDEARAEGVIQRSYGGAETASRGFDIRGPGCGGAVEGGIVVRATISFCFVGFLMFGGEGEAGKGVKFHSADDGGFLGGG